jgi:hypothetical protein
VWKALEGWEKRTKGDKIKNRREREGEKKRVL